MNGLLYLAVLLLLSALPLFAAYFWLSNRRPRFVPLPFFAAALCGLVAVALAAGIQSAYSLCLEHAAPLFRAFIIIALSEEGAKYLILRISGPILCKFSRRLSFIYSDTRNGSVIGIAASLGFVLFETALYASVEPKIALLRAFTAAPIHAAAGARIGSAAFSAKALSPKALVSILAAVALHGAYDLSLILQGFPIVIPISLAFLSLVFTLGSIKTIPSGGDI